MIDAEAMQDAIQEANPIPGVNDLDAGELTRFVAVANTRRPARGKPPPKRERPPHPPPHINAAARPGRLPSPSSSYWPGSASPCSHWEASTTRRSPENRPQRSRRRHQRPSSRTRRPTVRGSRWPSVSHGSGRSSISRPCRAAALSPWQRSPGQSAGHPTAQSGSMPIRSSS